MFTTLGAVAQKTWNHSRMCLLGVRTLKLSNFYIIAKTVEIKNDVVQE